MWLTGGRLIILDSTYLYVVIREGFWVASACSKVQQNNLETRHVMVGWLYGHHDVPFCVRQRHWQTHLLGVWVVEEVGPVWIRLHEPELKQLPETQLEDVERDLETGGQETFVFTVTLLLPMWYFHSIAPDMVSLFHTFYSMWCHYLWYSVLPHTQCV